MDDRVGDPVLDQRQRSLRHALRVEAAREGAGRARRVGKVDARGTDTLADATAQCSALLGVREPVEGEPAEELEQRSDGGVIEDDAVRAGRRDGIPIEDVVPDWAERVAAAQRRADG